MVETRLDQTAVAQSFGEVRTSFFVGLGIVNLQALASVGIVTGGVAGTVPVAIGSVPAIAMGGVRIAVPAIETSATAVEGAGELSELDLQALAQKQLLEAAIEEAAEEESQRNVIRYLSVY